MDTERHYIVYHNAEKMGFPCEEISRGPFDIVTNKPVRNIEQGIIWVICGEGKPRSYSLCSVFIVDETGDTEDADFKFYATGSRGVSFRPLIPLNNKDWFGEFLKSQYRFSFGLREIDRKFVPYFEELFDLFTKENPQAVSELLSELEVIESLTIEDYESALTILSSEISETDLLMLKTNFESPNSTTTATLLAETVGFADFNAANLRYGILARKFCELFQVQPNTKLSALVIFEKPEDEWHWIMRPQLIQAIRKLGWFDSGSPPNVLQDLDEHKGSYNSLDKTTRQAVIQSRIGQGRFRSGLIEYWQGGAVTGCQIASLLRASHIKPWRLSNNNERLDPFNGLLLVPNLDVAFDLGYISFENNGQIIISGRLGEESLLQLGIDFGMKLRKIEDGHINYLQYHRKLHGFQK